MKIGGLEAIKLGSLEAMKLGEAWKLGCLEAGTFEVTQGLSVSY
jgi:hypothetical protein